MPKKKMKKPKSGGKPKRIKTKKPGNTGPGGKNSPRKKKK